jgi:hypothetical protein
MVRHCVSQGNLADASRVIGMMKEGGVEQSVGLCENMITLNLQYANFVCELSFFLSFVFWNRIDELERSPRVLFPHQELEPGGTQSIGFVSIENMLQLLFV